MPVLEEIRSAEHARTRAIEVQDLDALDRVLADDFIYVHASGRTESKDDYLASLGSGLFQWSGYRYEDTDVRPLGETALLYGLLHARKDESGTSRDLLFRFVSVWVRREARWQLTFMQNIKPQLNQDRRGEIPPAAQGAA